MKRHLAILMGSLVLFALVVAGCSASKGAADVGGAASAAETDEEEATAEATSAEAVAATDDATADGKTANPGRPDVGPPGGLVEWSEEPLELGFPTKGWEVFQGQGKCMPQVACMELKAVKGDKEQPLQTREDVSKLVLLLEERDHALALMRFYTDHRFELSDERCQEAVADEEGTGYKLNLPKDTDVELPEFRAVKVVDFEGGFRVDRTLLCPPEGDDEMDRLVHVSETVWTQGHFNREETDVLIALPGLIFRPY